MTATGAPTPPVEERERKEARAREDEAWNARYKHRVAARDWGEIVLENPQRANVSRILAAWMSAYEAADAAAERAFRDLAAGDVSAVPVDGNAGR